MPTRVVLVATTCGRFIGFQDLFTISRETRFFFIVTYGLSTVVMCYVGSLKCILEGTTIAHPSAMRLNHTME